VPLALKKKCTLRANPDGAFTKSTAARLQKRFPPEKSVLRGRNFFSCHARDGRGKIAPRRFTPAGLVAGDRRWGESPQRWRSSVGRFAPVDRFVPRRPLRPEADPGTPASGGSGLLSRFRRKRSPTPRTYRSAARGPWPGASNAWPGRSRSHRGGTRARRISSVRPGGRCWPTAASARGASCGS